MLKTAFSRMSLLLAFGLFALTIGCQKQSGPDAGGSASAKTTQVVVEISGMTCSVGCAPRARDAIAALPWAKDVKVDFDRKQATFSAEKDRYDEAAILDALKNEGFGGKVLSK